MTLAGNLAPEEMIWYQSLKGVGAQNVPTYRCYFKLARQKVNDQNKGQKNGGHRLSFRENMHERTPLI